MKTAASGIFVLILAVGFACLSPVAVRTLRGSSGGVRTRIDAITKKCRAEFPARYFFVDLNGLYARCTGRRLCNRVFRRDDGMLVRAKSGTPLDPGRCSAGIASLSDDLAKNGTEFIFVQLPGKPDRGGELLTACVDTILSALSAANVKTVDLRDRYSGTDASLERYFFRTDHHWNMDAVIDAAELLSRRLGAENVFGRDRWERRVLRRWFLGSQGKRTGVCFGGVDDLAYYVPRHGGVYMIELTRQDGTVERASGGFEINMDLFFLESRGDVHEENAYKIYRGIGGITPCVRHRHPGAPVRKRVAVIGDSFVRPLEACLSAAVEDLLVVDPRYPCGTSSVKEKITAFRPDVVMLCINPFALVRNKGVYPQYAFCEFP